MSHTTHFDDCGCQSAALRKRIAELEQRDGEFDKLHAVQVARVEILIGEKVAQAERIATLEADAVAMKRFCDDVQDRALEALDEQKARANALRRTPMADRDLTPAEARAEIEAFMGDGWTVKSETWGTPKMVFADHSRVGIRVRGDAPTYRAAVDALKAAWRDAVRPWMEAAIEAKLDTADVDGYAPDEVVIARVLKEDSK